MSSNDIERQDDGMQPVRIHTPADLASALGAGAVIVNVKPGPADGQNARSSMFTPGAVLSIIGRLSAADRAEVIAGVLPAEGLPLVDALVEQAQRLDGVAFAELRTRLETIYDTDSVEGLPNGLLIVQHDGQYWPSYDTSPVSQTGFDEYADALDRLRVVAVDQMLAAGPDGDSSALPGEALNASVVTYYNAGNGLRLELLPIEMIVPDYDRDTADEFPQFWAMSKGATGREAFCALCGETCSPNGPDDMTHGQRLSEAHDGEDCGGPLVPVGWWH